MLGYRSLFHTLALTTSFLRKTLNSILVEVAKASVKFKMPTKATVPPSSEEKPRCGYCSGVLKKSDVEADLFKNCNVCGKMQKIKPKCAFKLVAKATGSPTDIYQPVQKNTFQNTDVNLMCTDCKEKCFFCNKAHVSRCKLINIYMMIYNIFLY